MREKTATLVERECCRRSRDGATSVVRQQGVPRRRSPAWRRRSWVAVKERWGVARFRVTDGVAREQVSYIK